MHAAAPENDSAADPRVGRVLLPRQRVAARVAELAARLHADYAGREVTILAVMNGATVFLADLVRHLPLSVRIETTTARSYRGSSLSPGGLTVGGLHPQAFAGRHVLVVDDILDTGRTLDLLVRRLAVFGPASLAVCVLLAKTRPVPRPLAPRYVGFEIPDEFVIGYGMDYDGLYRNLPDVCALHAPPEATR